MEAGKSGYTSNSGFFKVLGELCFHASTAMLILLGMLLAKGWTIVRRKISARGRVRIAVYMTIYVCVALIAVVWNESGNEPGTTDLDTRVIFSVWREICTLRNENFTPS
jgi:hypothetical protein